MNTYVSGLNMVDISTLDPQCDSFKDVAVEPVLSGTEKIRTK